MKQASLQGRVGVYTLGCKVNQYESEAIAEAFRQAGFLIAPPQETCDIYIINTCTVTAESDRKARQFIRRALTLNPRAYLLVTGCMAQQAPEAVAAIPGVDYVGGNAHKLAVVDAARALWEAGTKPEKPLIQVTPLAEAAFEPMSITRFDRTRAYVKIEDGCENHCTYCAIPGARGPVRSKSPDAVLREVKTLTENGCREVVLTGIETASYGHDFGSVRQEALARLLTRVDAIEGIGRVRLGSLDPSLMREPFVQAIATLPSLTPHFHLSMQSGSDRILSAMHRKYNRAIAERNIATLRRYLPHVMLTTDIIVGFPGETEDDFAETMDLIRSVRFLNVHVFPYSRRRGTVADSLPGQIPASVKHDRLARLTALQKDIRRELLTWEVERGEPVDVLFESWEDGVACGHTASFIEVCVQSPVPLHACLRSVRLTGVTESGCQGILIS